MAWTYVLTNGIGQVRFLIGDTLTTDPLTNTDEEITFCLTANNNDIYKAGAYACRAWAAKLNQALSVDQGSSGWKLDRDAQVARLEKRAIELDAQAASYSGLTPFAGGTSVSDKQARESDTDRVQPGTTVSTHRTPGLPNSGDGTENEFPLSQWY